jgi:hypothetical protein
MAAGAGNIMKAMLRGGGHRFRCNNYCGGSIVTAVVNASTTKAFTTTSTPPPDVSSTATATATISGGRRRGGRGESHRVRVVVIAAAARDQDGVSRAYTDKNAGGLFREGGELIIADIHRRSVALDRDLKEVMAQVNRVREGLGMLQTKTRVGNDLTSATEDLKKQIKSVKDELMSEIKARK